MIWYYRLLSMMLLTAKMLLYMAVPALAAENDLISVVNNLSDFIFGLILVGAVKMADRVVHEMMGL